MICPKCGKGKMLLYRVEYRANEEVYIYRCDKCGYMIEVSIHRQKLPWYPWRIRNPWYWREAHDVHQGF